MRRITSTKRGRLAVILAIAVVLFGGGFAYQLISNRRADDAAADLARRVQEHLGSEDRDDVDGFLTDITLAAWEGRDTSPFRVDGIDPDAWAEVADGFLVRYRVSRLGAERCVDAVWPDDGPLRVHVNEGCDGYDR